VVQDAYFNYFGSQKEVPILVLEIGELNFAEDETVFQRMVEAMGREWPVGVSNIVL